MSDDLKVCSLLSVDKRKYCEDLVSQCAKGGEPIVLDTHDGNKTNFQSQSACKNFAVFRAKTGVPEGFSSEFKSNSEGVIEDLKETSRDSTYKSTTVMHCFNNNQPDYEEDFSSPVVCCDEQADKQKICQDSDRFVSAEKPQKYQSKFERAKSQTIPIMYVAKIEDSIVYYCLGLLAEEMECEKINAPSAFQFIDRDQDGEIDKGEPRFYLGSSHGGSPLDRYPFNLGLGNEIEGLDLFMVGEGHNDCDSHEIHIRKPEVKAGVIATHIQNFKVVDLSGDGLYDVAFEFVDARSGATSLKVFLQQKE